MRLVILHNPGAAQGRIPPEELCAPFAEAGHSVLHRVFGQEDAAELGPDRADAVVVAGGDGTVARFIHAYRGTVRRFAILPLGTSNNIATGHGLPGTAAELAAMLPRARARRIDLGLLTGPFGSRGFIEGVGLGAVAEAMAEAEGRDLPGPEKRALSRERLRALLRAARPGRWEVVVDGTPLPPELLFVEIMNAPLIGPGLSPETGNGTGPGTGFGTGPGTGFGTGPGTGLGSGPGTGFGSGPGTRSEARSETGLGTGRGPSAATGSGLDPRPGNSGPHSGAHSAPGFEALRPDMGDGLLGVAYLRPEGREAACAGLGGGGTQAPIRCDMAQGREVTLTWRDGPLRIDDEFLDPPDAPLSLRARIDPSDLHLLVPQLPQEDRR